MCVEFATAPTTLAAASRGKVAMAMYCTVLYCTILYYTVLYCTVLYCILYCTILNYTLLYCSTLAVSRGKVAMSAMQAAVPAVASCPNNPGRAGGEP